MRNDDSSSAAGDEHGHVLATDEARWRSFAAAIDGIRRRSHARVGPGDLDYIRRVDRFSRRCGTLGRALLYIGPGPASFAAGVVLLWVYKQLQIAEIGHTVLHGAYNRIDGEHPYHSRDFVWQVPIDERSWIAGHNGRHHGLTNIQGGDPDIDYGYARLTHRAPHRVWHYFQVPLTLLTVPVFSVAMNAHFTGVLDGGVAQAGGPPKGGERGSPDSPVGDRDTTGPKTAAVRFFSKVARYFSRELGLFPLLAGPRFARVFLGNLLSEGMRDVYTAATVYCGHVGAQVASFPEGTRPKSKGERYAMQVTASNDFAVPWTVSVLCGGLDLQIEHHLFPTLPPQRLREISSEVKTACEEHGVQYNKASWPRTLWRAVRHMCRLSFPDRASANA